MNLLKGSKYQIAGAKYLLVSYVFECLKTRMHSSRMRTARTLTVGWKGCLPGEVSAQGQGVCLGGVCPGSGCLSGVRVSGRGQGVCPGSGCLPRVRVSAWGVSCDLSHYAFDVTRMLSQHQLSVSTRAAAYIV